MNKLISINVSKKLNIIISRPGNDLYRGILNVSSIIIKAIKVTIVTKMKDSKLKGMVILINLHFQLAFYIEKKQS